MPGASTAVVLRNSVSGGTRAGLETAVGANAGSVCFGILCAFGVSIAVQRWPSVWLVLRTAGVAYLAWLGIQSLRRAVSSATRSIVVAPRDAATEPDDVMRNVREGFITNTTNPALASFYFVILPQFIPRSAPVAQVALILTAIHVALALTWHAVWAAAGGTLSRVLSSGRARQALDLIAGIAFLALAVSLLV